MRGLFAASLILLAFACACGGGDDLVPVNRTATPVQATIAPAFQSLASRDIKKPDVPAGSCPVTPSVLISPTLPMAVGDGPVYVSGLGSDTSTTLVQVANSSWQAARVTFFAAPEFEGQVLVRGESVDGSALIAYDYAARQTGDPAASALQLDTSGQTDGDWRYWYADIRIQAPGCYFFQLDTGDAGSQTIIFTAR